MRRSDRRTVKAKVGVVELGRLDEALAIDDANLGAFPADPARVAQNLQGAVEMHRGHAQKIRQILLSDRQVEDAVVDDPR